MDDEIDFLKKTQTWILVNPPLDHQVINNRSITNKNNDGSVQRFKTKFVACCFQTNCWSWLSRNVPIARFDSIRNYPIYHSFEQNYLHQFDMLFFEELNEVIYMQQSKGYEDEIDRVCKLNSSLYGKNRHQDIHRFTSILKKHSLTSADYCVFKNGNYRDWLILDPAIHIDDGLISNELIIHKKLLAELRKKFEVTFNEINIWNYRLNDGQMDFCIRRFTLRKFFQRWKMLTQ